jgi:predicted AlkP superfamily pyrophosphatase or phosphodiesterase
VEDEDPRSFFCLWMFSFPRTLVEKIVLSLLNGFGTLVKNQLTIYVNIYFLALYSVPLVYLCDFLPAPHYFHYCSFEVILNSWSISSQTFSFTLIVLVSQDPFIFHMNFNIKFSFLQKNGILIGMCWICTLVWVVMSS